MTSTIETVLRTVTDLVPVATNLVQLLAGTALAGTGIPEVLAITSALAPIAADLVNKIEQIRGQTESQYPQVWAGIRTDWMATVAQWNGLKIQPQQP